MLGGGGVSIGPWPLHLHQQRSETRVRARIQHSKQMKGKRLDYFCIFVIVFLTFLLLVLILITVKNTPPTPLHAELRVSRDSTASAAPVLFCQLFDDFYFLTFLRESSSVLRDLRDLRGSAGSAGLQPLQVLFPSVCADLGSSAASDGKKPFCSI